MHTDGPIVISIEVREKEKEKNTVEKIKYDLSQEKSKMNFVKEIEETFEGIPWNTIYNKFWSKME